MSFVQRQLRFTFDLPGNDSFDNSGGANRLTVGGLRASAAISKGGTAQFGQADVSIYGLTLSEMNKLSTLGLLIEQVRRNVVSIEAGDEINGYSMVFQGTIINAYADFTAMPNNLFRMMALPGHILRLQPIPPTTINGQADAATLMSGLAQQGNLQFSNSGVQVQLSYPYLPGTVLEQIERVAKAADINFTIDLNTLFIWPRGKQRGSQIPIISPDTGMIGYPAFVSQGVQIATLFNPTLSFGQRVRVQGSAFTVANQDWAITSLSHDLDSMTPGGQWRTRFTATRPGAVVISRG